MPPVRSATASKLDPAVLALVKTLRQMQDQINRIERSQRTHQLDFFTVENGAIQHTDAEGNVRSVLGVQPDGTFAHALFNASAPLAPDVPIVGSGINSLSVTWDGFMSDGSAPLTDFAWVEIHINTTPNFTPSSADLAGHLYQAGSFTAPGLTAGITYYVTLIAVNTSGAASPPSTYSAATPASVVGSIPAGAITATQLGFQARSIGGITITVQPTPPGNPQFGDIWFDGSNGNLANTWNGSAWVPYQWGTNSIQAGSITAQLIAAGTIIAGAVDGTTITGAKFVATGTSGEILAYNGVPAAGNLVMAVSPVAGTDTFGNTYYAGVTTFNGFGAVVNLLSTDHAAFFQYFNHGTSSQGNMILSVASTSGTDPVTSNGYGAGFTGINPVFGDYLHSSGSSVGLGVGTVITRTGGILVQQAPSNSQNPYIKVDAPEETTASHMQMLLQGTSPDGTSLGQCVLGLVSGSGLLSPSTNAMMEIQAQSTGTSPILQLIAQAAAANSFGIEVVGDTFNRLRIDSNGKISEGTGSANQDVDLYRGAANMWQTDDALAFSNTSALSGAAGAGILYSASGQLSSVNPAGLVMTLQTANIPALNINTITAASFTNLSVVTIPAGDANLDGATYKWKMFGYGTWGSTAQSLTFGIRFGANASSIIGSIQTVAAATFGTSASFQWVADVTLTLVTNPGLSTATWRANARVTLASSGASITVTGGTGSSDITLDASVAEQFGLSCEWGSATGAPTISKSYAQFERTA